MPTQVSNRLPKSNLCKVPGAMEYEAKIESETDRKPKSILANLDRKAEWKGIVFAWNLKLRDQLNDNWELRTSNEQIL